MVRLILVTKEHEIFTGDWNQNFKEARDEIMKINSIDEDEIEYEGYESK